jgi:uncharacterized glyoxalase superfamily protein PhnB
MPDPFDELRAPVAPIEPDPTFTARLRARLEWALDLPEGVPMSVVTDDTPTITTAVLTPYLSVDGAREALDWYVAAFGARRRGEPIVMPDGRIGHAELEIGGAPIMLSDAHPEIGVLAPRPEGVSVTLHLRVDAVDAVIDRAVARGATLERPVADADYGRNGVLRDPFGHRWMVMGAPRHPSPRDGDIGYVSLWVPDVERAATFYAAALGWTYAPGSGPQGRQVEGQTLHHGLWGGEAHHTLFLCFAVADVRAAIGRVRDAGGTASELAQEPYGLLSECVDDQGTRFALFEPPGGVGTVPGPANGARRGDVSYVTMEVRDAAAARRFYGAVLGWRFSPGSVDDGWQVEDVVPMTGLHGGHDVATTVPMYRVDDVAAAVEAVRRAGGTATDPQVQPYGVTSTCTDDQGTRFYLGEH